jgi:hypothetical protein
MEMKKRHEKRHKDCSQCPATFIHKFELKLHILQVHGKRAAPKPKKLENIPPIAITSSTEVVQVCHQCGKEFQFEEIFKLPKDSDYFIEAFGAIENLPSKLKINKIFILLKILFFRAD